MEKDFDSWNQKKKDIHQSQARPFFHEAEIWICVFGLNIGVEQDGKGGGYLRPGVVIKKFNSESLWFVPLSTSQKNGIHYYSITDGVEKPSVVILSQVRLMDASRLRRKVGNISHADLIGIKEKIKQLLT